jgi:DNA-binding GntR family transcriptional regulator
MAGGHGESAAWHGTASALADELQLRIRGGDLPAGTRLDPGRLAAIHMAPSLLLLESLSLLEARGITVRADDGSHICAPRRGHARDIMLRARPALVAVVRLAATRASRQQIRTIADARDRLVGLAGDGSAAARAEGYRALMIGLADASGSTFLDRAIGRLLSEAAPLVEALCRVELVIHAVPPREGELLRLVEAVAAGDPDAAAEAADDHALLIGHRLDTLAGG